LFLVVKGKKMRLLFLIVAIAFGADALLYSGAYSQAAWRELSAKTEGLTHKVRDAAPQQSDRKPS
jgi:hypothetical protein